MYNLSVAHYEHIPSYTYKNSLYAYIYIASACVLNIHAHKICLQAFVHFAVTSSRLTAMSEKSCQCHIRTHSCDTGLCGQKVSKCHIGCNHFYVLNVFECSLYPLYFHDKTNTTENVHSSHSRNSTVAGK